MTNHIADPEQGLNPALRRMGSYLDGVEASRRVLAAELRPYNSMPNPIVPGRVLGPRLEEIEKLALAAAAQARIAIDLLTIPGSQG